MKRKLVINNVVSLISQFITVVCGMFLPRLLLSAFGSTSYGLMSSMSQMLSCISFLDLGVGSIVQTSFYKPLAKQDNVGIRNIYGSALKYFKTIARIFIIYIIFLMFYYSFINQNDFSPLYNITLLVALSISSFAQYYFGICNQLLLNADQKVYIYQIINSITVILNLVLSIILINIGCNIQIVKLFSSLLYLIRPLYLSLYVKKHYNLDLENYDGKNYIRNQWSGMIQHITTAVTDSVDTIVLTSFSTLVNVSIYNIYVLPLKHIKNFLNSVIVGYKSFFGKLLAEEKYDIVESEFNKFESIFHFVILILFLIVSKVLLPFVLVYTKGVNDANYANYAFSLWITSAYCFNLLKIPYTTIIFSAGHFKETQLYCFIECLINIVVSIILVINYGLVGVAIGTSLSTIYRMIASVYYLKRNIINRSYKHFIKVLSADLISLITFYLCTFNINMTELSVFSWVCFSTIISLICIAIVSLIFVVFYRDIFLLAIKKGRNKLN